MGISGITVRPAKFTRFWSCSRNGQIREAVLPTTSEQYHRNATQPRHKKHAAGTHLYRPQESGD